jgi:hypothetical protein
MRIEPVSVNHYPHRQDWENTPYSGAETKLFAVSETDLHGLMVWAADGKTYWRVKLDEDMDLAAVKGPYTLPTGTISKSAAEPTPELAEGIAQALSQYTNNQVSLAEEVQLFGPQGLRTYDPKEQSLVDSLGNRIKGMQPKTYLGRMVASELKGLWGGVDNYQHQREQELKRRAPDREFDNAPQLRPLDDSSEHIQPSPDQMSFDFDEDSYQL